MISALFNQPNYVAAKKLMDATVLRHEVIASNLANVETPNYKRLEVEPSFNQQLRQALALNNTSQIASIQPGVAVDAQALAFRPDGNNVQLEQELAEMNTNMVAYALESRLISGALLKLRLAITGRSS